MIRIIFITSRNKVIIKQKIHSLLTNTYSHHKILTNRQLNPIINACKPLSTSMFYFNFLFLVYTYHQIPLWYLYHLQKQMCKKVMCVFMKSEKIGLGCVESRVAKEIYIWRRERYDVRSGLYEAKLADQCHQKFFWRVMVQLERNWQ